MTSHKADMVWEWAGRWTAHVTDGLTALFTDDCLYEDTALEHKSQGTDALREFFDQTLVTFRYLKLELQSAVANDEMAAGEWTISGTHLGDFPGRPATGKPFVVSGSCVMRFDGDRIAHHRDYWNLVAFDRQVDL